jgi:Na+-translocating ferredoxin:NAD+ oxidoreductase RnfG subunit
MKYLKMMMKNSILLMVLLFVSACFNVDAQTLTAKDIVQKADASPARGK